MKLKSKLINSIVKEIGLRKDEINTKIESIYFGGGTPSLLCKEDINLILSKIYNSFNISIDAECTLECNPENVNSNIINDWKNLGINRISLGIQSFNDKSLQLMNRSHDSSKAFSSLQLLKNNFKNFSVDLIYGIPHSKLDDWKQALKIVTDLEVPHISAYVLTVEPKTALIKMIEKNQIKGVDEKNQRDQHMFAYEFLTKNGYENYEFSSFSKPGFQCKNNVTYWTRNQYIGFGPSAHSFNGTERKWNVSNNSIYMKKINANILPLESETLTQNNIFNEMIMVGLRRSSGIKMSEIESTLGVSYINYLNQEIKPKLEAGILFKKHNRITVKKNFKFVTDGIASELFITS